MAVVGSSLKSMTSVAADSWLEFLILILEQDFFPVERTLGAFKELLVTIQILVLLLHL